MASTLLSVERREEEQCRSPWHPVFYDGFIRKGQPSISSGRAARRQYCSGEQVVQWSGRQDDVKHPQRWSGTESWHPSRQKEPLKQDETKPTRKRAIRRSQEGLVLRNINTKSHSQCSKSRNRDKDISLAHENQLAPTKLVQF